jgi:hypothetical protein
MHLGSRTSLRIILVVSARTVYGTGARRGALI